MSGLDPSDRSALLRLTIQALDASVREIEGLERALAAAKKIISDTPEGGVEEDAVAWLQERGWVCTKDPAAAARLKRGADVPDHCDHVVPWAAGECVCPKSYIDIAGQRWCCKPPGQEKMGHDAD